MDFLLKKFWPSWQEQIDIKNTNTCESWNRLEGVFSSTCRPELHVKKTADCTFTVDGRYFSASPLKASESHPHELCSAPSSSPPPRPVTLCEDWQQHSSVGGVKSSSVPCVILNWSQVHYDSEGIRFPQHFLFVWRIFHRSHSHQGWCWWWRWWRQRSSAGQQCQSPTVSLSLLHTHSPATTSWISLCSHMKIALLSLETQSFQMGQEKWKCVRK